MKILSVMMFRNFDVDLCGDVEVGMGFMGWRSWLFDRCKEGLVGWGVLNLIDALAFKHRVAILI